ncbi:hypothetical protein MKX03_020347 [Papaver bracteatum]|nr:hypothetical protein MKX03_020347 [Papaver bracteatum]
MELQERIGKVGGLSKETISTHLKTRVGTTCVESAEEETKICTICQDKNVCPICKSQDLKTTEEARHILSFCV